MVETAAQRGKIAVLDAAVAALRREVQVRLDYVRFGQVRFLGLALGSVRFGWLGF